MAKHQADVQEIAAATGLSRTTIYRRLKNGESATDIMGSQAAPPTLPTDVAEPSSDDQAAISWCRAVLWAAENMNITRMTPRKAGSKLRFSMWQAAQEYPKALLVQLVPKALAILDKNKKPDEEAEIEEAERLEIAELEELLEGALIEAGI